MAIAAGLSLGAILGFRGGKALVLRVGGPFASKPVVKSLAVVSSLLFFMTATFFAMVIGTAMGGGHGEAARSAAGSDSLGALFGIAAGTAVIITSGLMVSSFTGALCGRLIENFRSQS